MPRWLAGAALLLAAWVAPVLADGAVTLETRPGVTVTSYEMPRPGADATLLILTGGSGNIGMKEGIPASPNFLVRSRDRFAGAGFNVFVMGRPSDRPDLDSAFRAGASHGEDIRQAVAHLRQTYGVPVWLVGTSRGTISATAAAIALGEQIAGIVLTASVTSYRIPGAVPTQKLDAIRVPVLVMHHQRDACPACSPNELGWIMDGLKNAPVTKRVLVDSVGEPSGDKCEALHWHGFIDAEDEAVATIAQWIRHPAP